MAARKQPTPPTVHPAFDVAPAATAPPPETPLAEGVADRGAESAVGFYTDSAGQRFVAHPHRDAGKSW